MAKSNCQVPNCRAKEVELIYYGFNVCLKHWNQHCANRIDLKKIFDISG